MKNVHFPTALFLLSLLIFPSCQTINVDIQTEKDAIRELDRSWTEAIRNQDIENVMNKLASDAIFMVDDLPIIEGKEAIREAQLEWYADTTIDFSTFQDELLDIQISLSGDIAYTRIKENFMQSTPEGMTEQWSKWINIWKKVDGRWLAVVVVGNQDNP